VCDRALTAREYLGSRGYQTAKTRFGIIIGLCICWDIAFPEVFRELSLKQHAQLVIAPAYWCFDDAGDIGLNHDSNSEVNLVNSVCTLRPFENEISMVLCNGANDENKDHCPEQEVEHLIGRSQISVPFKGTIVRADHAREEMIMADIDVTGITNDAEQVYKIRKDWNEGNIHNGPQRK
jgi:predicted amidohydrolase